MALEFSGAIFAYKTVSSFPFIKDLAQKQNYGEIISLCLYFDIFLKKC